MPRRICSSAGCRITTTNMTGRCDKHPFKSKPSERKEYQHDTKGRYIYNTAIWRKLRAAKIAENPLCEDCEARGEITEAKDVDHIIEIQDGGEPYPSLDGLRSLCRSCHGQKTARENKKR